MAVGSAVAHAVNESAGSQNDGSETLPALGDDGPAHSGSHDIGSGGRDERDD